MKNQEQIIQEEMRKLIRKSCADPETGSRYCSFQKALLKFFFNATDVSLDMDGRSISLWTAVNPENAGARLYNINEAVCVKISYSNLEETLKGCLEKGAKQERFYKSMLFYYNNVAESENRNSLSA